MLLEVERVSAREAPVNLRSPRCSCVNASSLGAAAFGIICLSSMYFVHVIIVLYLSLLPAFRYFFLEGLAEGFLEPLRLPVFVLWQFPITFGSIGIDADALDVLPPF